MENIKRVENIEPNHTYLLDLRDGVVFTIEFVPCDIAINEAFGFEQTGVNCDIDKLVQDVEFGAAVWFGVFVTASSLESTGSSSIGGFYYDSYKAFLNDSYLDNLISDALTELKK